MKTTYKFNMVEIALAIAIIAIGLSAVLVLFPVGINATRAAMDENSSADVSEYVANFVRGQCLSHWKNEYDSWYPNRSNAARKLTFSAPSGLWATSKPDTPANPDDEKNLSDITDYTVTTTNPKSGLRRIGTDSGVFRFSRVTAEGEETFAALVKIWSASGGDDLTGDVSNTAGNCPLYIPDAANSFQPKRVKTGEIALTSPDGEVQLSSFAQSVLVEISWPTTAAEEDRTSRTFRVDVYNPYYTIRPDTPATP